MNTTQHKTKTITRHEVVMEPNSNDGWGTLDRREIGDFLIQADRTYETVMGHAPHSDDAYHVRGDEEGLRAFWDTED